MCAVNEGRAQTLHKADSYSSDRCSPSDLAMVQYYSWVESFWAARRNTSLSAVSVVSLSGGDRDVQVRPHQTNHPSSDISAVVSTYRRT